jgi:hypothetical protein
MNREALLIVELINHPGCAAKESGFSCKGAATIPPL